MYVCVGQHYGAYLPAFFLWAGHTTGLSKLLTERAVAYCSTVMAGYLAGEWEWNESISNEQARFLLNLAWLVRVDDTPLHRQWLRKMAGDLIQFQDNTTGAIRQVGLRGSHSVQFARGALACRPVGSTGLRAEVWYR
eukprot:COSAG01_NODE_8950_length_2606_cov_1.299960_4_plen_137_part_00